jgi:hypothetical protein
LNSPSKVSATLSWSTEVVGCRCLLMNDPSSVKIVDAVEISTRVYRFNEMAAWNTRFLSVAAPTLKSILRYSHYSFTKVLVEDYKTLLRKLINIESKPSYIVDQERGEYLFAYALSHNFQLMIAE